MTIILRSKVARRSTPRFSLHPESGEHAGRNENRAGPVWLFLARHSQNGQRGAGIAELGNRRFCNPPSSGDPENARRPPGLQTTAWHSWAEMAACAKKRAYHDRRRPRYDAL